MNEEKAAVAIQAQFRGHRARKELKEVEKVIFFFVSDHILYVGRWVPKTVKCLPGTFSR
jgi:hypothetical protein